MFKNPKYSNFSWYVIQVFLCIKLGDQACDIYNFNDIIYHQQYQHLLIFYYDQLLFFLRIFCQNYRIESM